MPLYLRFNVLMVVLGPLAYGLDTATNQSSILALVEDLRSNVAQLTDRLLLQEKLLESKCKCTEGTPTEDSRNRRVLLHEGAVPASPQVAFYTQLSADKTGLGDFQIIAFDLVTTNIGNGYNQAVGVFTAPVDGVYLWSTTNWGTSDYTQTEIVVNAVMKGRAWSDSGSHADVASATGSAVLAIDAGDAVWIRSNTVHSHNTIKGMQLSWFSGWLLY